MPHGGYRQLKSFQLSQLIYDLTVRFVELFIDSRSRTCDQMVQAARSGRQIGWRQILKQQAALQKDFTGYVKKRSGEREESMSTIVHQVHKTR